MTAFRNVYNKGGIGAFWAGFQPKMVESFLKGGILLFAKDAAMRSMKAAGATEVTAGLAGGFVGGCAQVVIMGPCTFLVTAAVTGDKSVSVYKHAVDTFKTRGIGGFYHGGTALLLRQGTFSCAQFATIIQTSLIFDTCNEGSNWASRQGFTDFAREVIKKGKARSGESSSDVSLVRCSRS
jgi:hypothetical protein